ncbi:MAG: primosomal protein N' [Clostridia bacterium]|nr:primosomal protein N' [Clostridia bacterium]
MKIASVIMDSGARPLDRGFSYSVPSCLDDAVMVGVRVRVPFGAGNRQAVAYVIKVSEAEEEENLKAIAEVLDAKPLFDRNILLEAYWIKNRYFVPFSVALKLFLPPGSSKTLTEWIRLEYTPASMGVAEKKVADILSKNDGVCAFDVLKVQLGEKTRNVVRAMEQQGIVSVTHSVTQKVNSLHVRVVRLVKEPEKKISDAGMRAVRIMRDCAFLSIADLCLFASCSSSTVRTLIKNNILEMQSITVLRPPLGQAVNETHEGHALNAEQFSVAKGIKSRLDGAFKPMLLRGVTGSGKTEVYLNVIEEIVQKNGSAIVLVPEIALTHQMVSRFISRFGAITAVLHSGLSAGQRHDEWIRIARGEARVVVGARSAVFAPCQNLQLIVIDEEHEDTYKSESGVRYHARTVAMCRAHTEGAQVLLASATPSIESYYFAKTGKYTLFELTQRYNHAALPFAEIVDMRKELEQGNRSPLSRSLQSEIQKNIENHEQSILFLNRRGYETFVSCRACGHVISCPHCSISLTYHSFSETLDCHYCGYKRKMVEVCPACGSAHIRGFGTGTQKIEETVAESFPKASLLRMDVDTTRQKGAHEKILRHFREENTNILLGTQMIAKGLDFPNVTLVGVLNPDQMLNLGDFRASEKTFSLITQVCGRAGRGEKPGRAIIQTYSPDSAVIQHAGRQDYTAFYEEEIILRKALNYPPFCDIINVIVMGKDERKVREGAKRLEKAVSQAVGNEIHLFHAGPCAVYRVKNVYRWHFWMKCKLSKSLCESIAEVIKMESALSVVLDVEPTSI